MNELRNILQEIVVVSHYLIFIGFFTTTILFYIQYRQIKTPDNKIFVLIFLGLTFDRFVSIVVGKYQLLYFGWGLDWLVIFFLLCRVLSQGLMLIGFYLFGKYVVIPRLIPEIKRRLQE